MAQFQAKVWKDDPDTTTPISAAALMDLEERVYAGAVADAVDAVGVGPGGGSGAVFSASMPTTAPALWVKLDGSGNIIGLSAVVDA